MKDDTDVGEPRQTEPRAYGCRTSRRRLHDGTADAVSSELDFTSELGDIRRRLENVEEERQRAEKVQSALYRIAELASAAQDMQEFYRAVHGVVAELMFASNCFIALYDAERELISWPYYVDELDDPDTIPTRTTGTRSGAATHAGRPRTCSGPASRSC